MSCSLPCVHMWGCTRIHPMVRPGVWVCHDSSYGPSRCGITITHPMVRPGVRVCHESSYVPSSCGMYHDSSYGPSSCGVYHDSSYGPSNCGVYQDSSYSPSRCAGVLWLILWSIWNTNLLLIALQRCIPTDAELEDNFSFLRVLTFCILKKKALVLLTFSACYNIFIFNAEVLHVFDVSSCSFKKRNKCFGRSSDNLV